MKKLIASMMVGLCLVGAAVAGDWIAPRKLQASSGGSVSWTSTEKMAYIDNVIITTTASGSTNTISLLVNDGTDVHTYAYSVSTNNVATAGQSDTIQLYPTPYQSFPVYKGWVVTITNSALTNVFNVVLDLKTP